MTEDRINQKEEPGFQRLDETEKKVEAQEGNPGRDYTNEPADPQEGGNQPYHEIVP